MSDDSHILIFILIHDDVDNQYKRTSQWHMKHYQASLSVSAEKGKHYKKLQLGWNVAKY